MSKSRRRNAARKLFLEKIQPASKYLPHVVSHNRIFSPPPDSLQFYERPEFGVFDFAMNPLKGESPFGSLESSQERPWTSYSGYDEAGMLSFSNFRFRIFVSFFEVFTLLPAHRDDSKEVVLPTQRPHFLLEQSQDLLDLDQITFDTSGHVDDPAPSLSASAPFVLGSASIKRHSLHLPPFPLHSTPPHSPKRTPKDDRDTEEAINALLALAQPKK